MQPSLPVRKLVCSYQLLSSSVQQPWLHTTVLGMTGGVMLAHMSALLIVCFILTMSVLIYKMAGTTVLKMEVGLMSTKTKMTILTPTCACRFCTYDVPIINRIAAKLNGRLLKYFNDLVDSLLEAKELLSSIEKKEDNK